MSTYNKQQHTKFPEAVDQIIIPYSTDEITNNTLFFINFFINN